MNRNSLYRDSSKDSRFDSRGLSYDLSGNNNNNSQIKGGNSQRQLIELMFTMIATCH